MIKKKELKIKGVNKQTLYDLGFRRRPLVDEMYEECYRYDFPIKRGSGLFGVIRIYLPSGICRTDVITSSGDPYPPYYIRDLIHIEYVHKIDKKIRYELNKVKNSAGNSSKMALHSKKKR